MKIRTLSCFLLLLTLLPHQAKADGVVGKAIKLTKEKLKVVKPGSGSGSPNTGVQTGYSAILRAPAATNIGGDPDKYYPSILGTMRFSTIRTTQNPNGSGNVNIACGGSLLSGTCTAVRNANQITIGYKAVNFNYTDMRQTNLSLVGADPNILLPSHWVYSIIGDFNVQMTGNTGLKNNARYLVNYYVDWYKTGDIADYYTESTKTYGGFESVQNVDMSVTIKKN